MKSRQLARGGLLTSVLLALLTGGSAIVLAAVRHRNATGGAAASAPPRQLAIVCESPSLGGSLPALVYLPAGYDPAGARLPVIYFLHGLPTGTQSYTQNGFVAAGVAAAHRQAIVVAPQGVRGGGALSDREYLDWAPRENWPQAISRDLTACIDRRFHTVAARRGRALIGLSAGGYGAFNIGLRNLATFAAVESWSGYFAATDPSGYHMLKFSSAEQQRAATVPAGAGLAGAIRAYPALLAFYVGRADTRFAGDNAVYDASLSRAGVPHAFRTYAGGHSTSLWQAHAETWLAIALRFLASGQVGLH